LQFLELSFSSFEDKTKQILKANLPQKFHIYIYIYINLHVKLYFTILKKETHCMQFVVRVIYQNLIALKAAVLQLLKKMGKKITVKNGPVIFR